MKPAVVRFYFDEDILGVAKLLASINSEITYPGDSGGTVHKRVRPPCPIQKGTQDPIWIPEVSPLGWLIITRDAAIKDHRREIEAVLENGGRMVALVGEEAANNWAQLEVVMTRWREIDMLTGMPGPFVMKVTRTGKISHVV